MAASADHLKALVQAQAVGDEQGFRSVVLQIAAKAARQGHGRLAADLRDLLEEHRFEKATGHGPGKPTPVVRPKGELADLVSADYPELRLSDMTLSVPVSRALERIIHEQRSRAKLESRGFEPVHRVLLVGPPGTGKSMTAAVLARELGLPLFTVRLDGVISRFMGETSSKLRVVFEAAKQHRAVYLFDEFDAIGAERAITNDVGEARRILNSFLLFLDESRTESLVIAATNHPGILDSALFRRFDSIIAYDLPGEQQAVDVLRRRLAMMNPASIEWNSVQHHTSGLSHAELVRAAENAAKQAILSGENEVDVSVLVGALDERRNTGRG